MQTSEEVRVYDPIGACIYCGSQNQLSDEHIIPLGLYGKTLLRQASCKACAKITGAFEGVVLRTILGDVRMRNNFPTRHRKERPMFRYIGTSSGGKRVSTSEFPAPYVVYQFSKAGILLGAPAGLVIEHKVPVIIPDESHDEFQKRHAWDGIIKFKFQPNEFRRMLLKIGYCYAVAQLGYRSFRPFSLPYFMTKDGNLSYLAGQNSEKEERDPNSLHKTMTSIVRLSNGQWLIVVEIRLFAGAETPTYHVVVGDFESPAQRLAMLETIRRKGNLDVLIREF